MKTQDLVFKAAGCCGEVKVATVAIDDAVLHIYDEAGLYRVMKTVGGAFVPPMLHGQSAEQVDALLPA